MNSILRIFVFLCCLISVAPLAADSGELEQSLNESLTGLSNFAKDLDPNQPHQNSVNAQGQASGVLPKDSSLLDRMILKIKQKFEKEMNSNPFRRMSGSEVENIVIQRTKGTFIGDYLVKSPRVLYFIVNFLRDEFAMHDMFQIFKKEKELKKYSYFVLGNMIFFFFLGLYYDRKSRSGFIRTVFRKLFLFILSTSISLTVFYVIFHKELNPTIQIAQESITKAI